MLSRFKNFLKNINSDDFILIVYCGHGSYKKWNIGISYYQLLEIFLQYNNKLLIVSDCCFSDSMNISSYRKNTYFISSARDYGSDEDTSAFFTDEGGFMSTNFYNIFHKNNTINSIYKKLLSFYYYETGNENYLPRLFFY